MCIFTTKNLLNYDVRMTIKNVTILKWNFVLFINLLLNQMKHPRKAKNTEKFFFIFQYIKYIIIIDAKQITRTRLHHTHHILLLLTEWVGLNRTQKKKKWKLHKYFLLFLSLFYYLLLIVLFVFISIMFISISRLGFNKR